MKIIIVMVVLVWGVFSLDNGEGLRPPMGWNSWNHFWCGINEQIVRETADALVSSGLAKKGYVYVNVDDCWEAQERDPKTKRLMADPKTFPSGMKALGDYIHGKGLKFGIYSDAGFYTCQHRPASLHNEDIDAQTFADWGVDYLKYDNCYNDGTSPKTRYPPMRDALNKTGRHIYYSMCEWGVENPADWAGPVANSWRTTGDIEDKWSSFLSILDKQIGLEKAAGKGAWNDPDMLEVGNGGMTHDEYKAHFALWCLLKSPLLTGNDIRKISPEVLEILGNEEVIALNQDDMGVQGKRVVKKGDLEVWQVPLVNNQVGAIFFNRGGSTATISATFKELQFSATHAKIRELYDHKDLGVFSDQFSASVRTHSVVVVKLTPA